MASLDPGAITPVLHVVLDGFQAQFEFARRVAAGLLTGMATLEVAVFGILFAFTRSDLIGPLVRLTLRLGILTFLVNGYGMVVAALLSGFTRLAQLGHGGTAGTIDNATPLNDPVGLFLLGYDAGLSLIDVAVRADAQQPGIAILFSALGLGTITLLGLIAVRIVHAVAVFHGLSVAAILLAPLGAFSRWGDTPDRLLSAAIGAALRVMIVAFVAGLMLAVWPDLGVGTFDERTPLDASIGLLFVLLTFLFLIGAVPDTIVRALSGLLANTGETMRGYAAPDPVAASFHVLPLSGAAVPAVTSRAALTAAATTSGIPAPMASAVGAAGATAEVFRPIRDAALKGGSDGAYAGRAAPALGETFGGRGIRVEVRPTMRVDGGSVHRPDRDTVASHRKSDGRIIDAGRVERLRQMRLAARGGKEEEKR